MKNCLQSLLLLSFLICLSTNSYAQELVKPVPNKAVKKADVKKTSDQNVTINSNNGNESEKSKAETQVIESTVPTKGTVDPNPSKATQDPENYQELKSEWIKNNPEKYKKVNGNPNLIILTEQEFNALSPEEQTRVLADEVNYLIIR